MTYGLTIYLTAFALFWTVYTASVMRWTILRRREVRANIRARLVLE